MGRGWGCRDDAEFSCAAEPSPSLSVSARLLPPPASLMSQRSSRGGRRRRQRVAHTATSIRMAAGEGRAAEKILAPK